MSHFMSLFNSLDPYQFPVFLKSTIMKLLLAHLLRQDGYEIEQNMNNSWKEKKKLAPS